MDGPLDHPTLTGRSIACVWCGYALRGLAGGGACPECGRPVADSLKDDLLVTGSRARRRVVAGALLMLVAMVMVVVLYGTNALIHLLIAPFPHPESIDRVILIAGALVAGAAAWIGTPRVPRHHRSADGWRWLARGGLTLSLLCMVVLTTGRVMLIPGAWSGPGVFYCLILADRLVGDLGRIGLLLWGRHLALRLSRDRLARWFAVLAAIYGGSFVVQAGLSVIWLATGGVRGTLVIWPSSGPWMSEALTRTGGAIAMLHVIVAVGTTAGIVALLRALRPAATRFLQISRPTEAPASDAP